MEYSAAERMTRWKGPNTNPTRDIHDLVQIEYSKLLRALTNVFTEQQPTELSRVLLRTRTHTHTFTFTFTFTAMNTHEMKRQERERENVT